MKRLIIFCLLFSVGFCAIGAPLAVAAELDSEHHLPTDKVLEFSLSRLKESIERTVQKNGRLAFENDMLRKGIHDLKMEKEFLSGKKEALSRGVPASDYLEKRLQPVNAPDMIARERRTKDLIIIFQTDIMRLREEVRLLEESLDGQEFNKRRETLLEKIKESEQDLVLAEKRLKASRQKNRGPAEKVEALKEKQNELVNEIKSLESSLRGY